MSQNKSSRKKGTLAKRVLVWVLVALMVLGTVVPSLLWIFTLDSSAAYDTHTDDTIVRIGLLYGTSVVPAFQTRSPYGFTVCSVDKESDEVTELYTLSDVKTIETTVDKNLLLQGGDYIPTSKKGDIGAYHVMLDMPLTLDEMYLAMHIAVDNGCDAPMIASYIDGAYYLLVGNFSDEDSAWSYIDSAGNIFEGFEVDKEPCEELTVLSPSETALNLIDYQTNMIVFRYDGKDYEELGLMAIDSPDDERAYLQTPANKLYDGVFIFSRYEDGVELVNLIGLEDYVMGVLPYEISNSWPLETQKAFAVAVRSYTVNTAGKHAKTYEFDLCNTVCCQAYNGVRNINDTVRKAVKGTRGQVLVSRDGEIITTYYSAVAGGTTVSAREAWGGSGKSYLLAKPTPWEDYSTHPNGTWKWSVSPSDLADLLISKGYNTIKGDIVDVQAEYADDSLYVYKLTFTDEYGNEAQIKNTDTVRSKLSPNLKSANFVVGQGSVTINDPAFASESEKRMFSRLNGSKISYINWTEPMCVATSDGESYTWASVDTPVITANGEIEYVDRSIKIRADKGDDFIFVGRGWGHGVGLSQVGAYSLGLQGFDAEFILTAYFADTHLEYYSDMFGEKKEDDAQDTEEETEVYSEKEDPEDEEYEDEDDGWID